MLTEFAWISFGFISFSMIHSLFSALFLKKWFISKFPGIAPLYRLIFNVAQTLLFFIMLVLVPKPMQIIWQTAGFWFYLLRLVQFTMLILLAGSFRHFNSGEFLGLGLAKKWLMARKLNIRVSIDETGDEVYELNQTGFYGLVRHPIYLFTIILFLSDPVMRLFQLYLVFWLILYFYVGSVFEERRLVRIFGQQYMDYQRRVDRLFPLEWLFKKLTYSSPGR
jgi:protein-S-isoprenylcysteine O-methyltransferase Ste14